jgi:hypothetical protein
MIISDEMVEAAFDALCDQGFTEPYSARVINYVTRGSVGAERQQQLAEFKAADERADKQNLAAVRAVLVEAMAVHVAEEESNAEAAKCGTNPNTPKRMNRWVLYWWMLAAINLWFVTLDVHHNHRFTAIIETITFVLCVHFGWKARRR